jgi:hypothetical protein
MQQGIGRNDKNRKERSENAWIASMNRIFNGKWNGMEEETVLELESL